MTDLNELIQRQLKFEQERKLVAIQKFRKDTRKMRYDMKSGYMSGTSAGRSAVTRLANKCIPIIEELVDTTLAKSVGSVPKLEACYLIDYLGTELVLGITIKTLFDVLGKYTTIRAIDVVAAVNSRLRIEICRKVWAGNNPQLIQDLEYKYRHAGVWHKITAIKTIVGKTTGQDSGSIGDVISNISLSQATDYIIGVLAKNTNWFSVVTEQVNRTKRIKFMVLNEEFERFYRKHHEHIEAFLIQSYPMLCPPRDWSSDGRDGGFLIPVERYTYIIKDRKGVGSTISDLQVKLINECLQPVEYTLNKPVFEVMDHLFGVPGAAVGSFKPISFHPNTNDRLPDFIEALSHDHPARVAWRQQQAALHKANAESRREGVRSVRTVSAGRIYRDIDRFWIPWGVGHVGRAYPLSAGALSPHQSDSEKSLLTFHQRAPMTDRGAYHLALHLANVYGVDQSHEAKIDWCSKNAALIEAVATEPLDTIPIWEKADDPWHFLAACKEYYHCVLKGDWDTTGLPCSADATASGLQLLALLSRDRVTAERVNLIPGLPQKSDIYGQLREIYKEVIEEAEFNEGRREALRRIYINRKISKGNLITRVYGSVHRSRKRKIVEEITEIYNGQFGVLEPGDAGIIARCFEEAMSRLAGSSLALFENLQSVGSLCAKREMPVTWVTPVGNTVVIRPMKNPSKPVMLGWFGKLNISNNDEEMSLVKAKIRSSAAPTIVHSLDAAVLTEALHDWRLPVMPTHDCFAFRATDMDEGIYQVLDAYRTVLRDPEKFLHGILVSNDIDPNSFKWNIVGTLTDTDIENIIDCKYAIC